MASAAVADVGSLVGGVLISRLRLSVLSILKLMTTAMILSAAAGAGLTLFSCSEYREIGAFQERYTSFSFCLTVNRSALVVYLVK